MSENKYKVLVLDMQPIDPPVGGGRLRLLGLYHALGMPTTYVGTYDWPGEKKRDHLLTPSLREIDIPLSADHFAACQKWQERAGGRTIIDSAFHQLGHLSPEYVNKARAEVEQADIVIFSHPWIYPLVKDCLRQKPQLVVYDSHNVEGYLRATLLDDGRFGTEIVREVVRVEHELCHSADLILACSQEDRELFSRLYDLRAGKIRIVPNGVFTRQITPVDGKTKQRCKKELGLPNQPCAIFIGSSYVPNVEAADFICDELAPALPEVTFVIAGGVGDSVDRAVIRSKKISNVHITGFLTDEQKKQYLAASDIAVNPMFSGSGTNIKMFDFMAAGLPVITTPVGARGIETGSDDAFICCEKTEFSPNISNILQDSEQYASLARTARSLAEQKYSWERVSAQLGKLLIHWQDHANRQRPYFSVIVPSYERPELLSKLVGLLSSQTFQDFEVIIVDQSSVPWPDKNNWPNLDLLYIHSDIKGAITARNLAAFFARGEIIAFTDDDCEPDSCWLENARSYFEQPNVIGVEGLIKSDKMDDPNYRTVSNEGFEGIGFMTANLFLKLDIFNAVNGFDERFDNPHFREDTDLGWRALQHGDISFAGNVYVFHPPHLRDLARESSENRNKFFEKDVILLQKHPVKYKELFLKEVQWIVNPGFWENFERGAKKYGIEIPDFYRRMAGKDK